MASELSPDVKFDIGHVLFIDIVGYSKLVINKRSQLLQTLKEIVRATEQCRLWDPLCEDPRFAKFLAEPRTK